MDEGAVGLNAVPDERLGPLAQPRVVASTPSLITVEAEFRRPDGASIARASGQQIVQALVRP